MKKIITGAILCIASLLPVLANGELDSAGTEKEFVPKKQITWYCTSSPGGGSDIFTRSIVDIINSKNLINGQNIIIQYKTDGAGEVGRYMVANTRIDSADYTLLTFNSGDLMPMCQNTDNRVENFKPIAHMAVDKQLIFVGENSKYNSFKDVLDALKKNAYVVVVGSKGDDIACYDALCKELNVTSDQLAYIPNDSTSAAITAMLGKHMDLLISKPASASQYVEAGRLKPILALSSTRFPGTLGNAPTLSEFGYHNVEIPVWRSVAGPKNMSPAAVKYWSHVMEQVSLSPEWKNGYIEKNKLIPEYKNYSDFLTYVTKYQADYLRSIGKGK
jgi:putative tricarboxylic transport membrane protein